jgi:AcrR family transcriptional regulator
VADGNTDFRQQILDSAELNFAQASFDSVSLKDIATPVGVTPAMIHYYFGSKKELLAGVMEQALAPMADAMRNLAEKQNADLEEFVRLLYSSMQNHPNLPFLLFRQVLLPGSPMQQHFLENLAPRLGGMLPAIIEKEQKSGRISPQLDPAITALMVLSLCVFPLISRPLSQPALGISFDQAGRQQIQQHIIHFLHGGLQSS